MVALRRHAVDTVKQNANRSFEWLVRAVIIGMLAWAGNTLISVDTRLEVLEFRMTLIEGHHND